MTSFDFRPRTRVLFGPGEFARLGEVARELSGTRCLLVADPGMVVAGHAQEATRTLRARRMDVFGFHDFGSNPTTGPTTSDVEAGREFAAPHKVNLIVALGGSGSLDCAKAINFVLSNGGHIRDYWGYGKAAQPMLPMIAVPTSAGSGGEAQTYATVTDLEKHAKMACGDAKVAFRAAILDPKLTLSQPRELAAAAAFDALSHALESLVTTRSTALSDCFSRSAWRLIDNGLERMLEDPEDLEARGALLLGAHFGGLAVENSMLGAAHACANPLTTHFNIPHGTAIALMLSHVVEWNSAAAGSRYAELYPGDLVHRLHKLAEKASLPLSLHEAGVPEEALPRLAEDAATQWTGRFNPRAFDTGAALEIYQMAY